MATNEQNRNESQAIAELSIRKETKEQLAALNETLVQVRDELKAVHEALAMLSKTLIGFNVSQNQ